ncbi:MAG: DNA polymerase III [Planctomycetota bacterium]|nr:MAG: DNA polymerase III [Planctomycetota bacterium]
MNHLRLDTGLVIDIEATCWEKDSSEQGEPEIIEIGVVSVNFPERKLVSKESILIRPRFSKVSTFCTKLTGLTQEMVDGGVSLEEGCQILREKYLSMDRLWMSWGRYDFKIFAKWCEKLDIEYPFSPEYINLKMLFAILMGLKKPVGLLRALDMLGISFEGSHHRGSDDAWNTGKILVTLLSMYHEI